MKRASLVFLLATCTRGATGATIKGSKNPALRSFDPDLRYLERYGRILQQPQDAEHSSSGEVGEQGHFDKLTRKLQAENWLASGEVGKQGPFDFVTRKLQSEDSGEVGEQGHFDKLTRKLQAEGWLASGEVEKQ